MSALPNILLVDDEERFINSLDTILSYYDYECTKVMSGGEAINLLQRRHFDLALLDVELPDMSGCDIAEFIKISCKQTTSIMLTGISTIEIAVRAMKQGAYDFLSKPIKPDLLIKTIDKALQHNKLTRELLVSESRFQTLAEATWEGIVLHEKGRLIEANQQFVDMFGYAKDELAQGIFLEKVLTPASLQIVRQHIENSIFGSYEITGVRRDGKELPLEIKSRMITYLGRPAEVCAVRDLSERVRAEEEKLALQQRLAKANKLKALGLMAGSVAHDLNNILSGVVSYPDLLLMQMHETDRFYNEIKKIQEAGKRAAAVVADLVVLARGGAPTATVVSINDLITSHLRSIEHSERLAHFPNVVVQTNLQQKLNHIRCSPQHIHKILLNLIGNSLEAIKKDGIITITTENCRFVHPELSLQETTTVESSFVKITFADNGPGIVPKHMEHIFDPFYTTKVMGKSGTGLGLTIVWNSIQEYNGWIEVKNGNPGAVFEIYLPATNQKANPVQPQAEASLARANGRTILLVDDQPEQNETISKLLESLGYVTFSVTSGEEALTFLESRPVDLVLLDMIMGEGFNGRETYERIVQIRPGQKAIIMSGYSRSEEVQQARALGVSQFLEKPVTLPKIRTAIRQTLSMP